MYSSNRSKKLTAPEGTNNSTQGVNNKKIHLYKYEFISNKLKMYIAIYTSIG